MGLYDVYQHIIRTDRHPETCSNDTQPRIFGNDTQQVHARWSRIFREGESLTHTRWSGGLGYLRRGKWKKLQKKNMSSFFNTTVLCLPDFYCINSTPPGGSNTGRLYGASRSLSRSPVSYPTPNLKVFVLPPGWLRGGHDRRPIVNHGRYSLHTTRLT